MLSIFETIATSNRLCDHVANQCITDDGAFRYHTTQDIFGDGYNIRKNKAPAVRIAKCMQLVFHSCKAGVTDVFSISDIASGNIASAAKLHRNRD